jgi:prolyl-tRNA synthetase
MCVLNKKEGATESTANDLYTSLRKQGIDVLMDDRDEKPGSQFADADLMGIPLRIIVSPRNLKEGKVEFKFRDGRSQPQSVAVEDVVSFISSKVKEEYARYAQP